MWPVLVDREALRQQRPLFHRGAGRRRPHRGRRESTRSSTSRSSGAVAASTRACPTTGAAPPRSIRSTVLYMLAAAGRRLARIHAAHRLAEPDIEPYFNDTSPAQYDLFDVKYVLLRPDASRRCRRPRSPTAGLHALARSRTSAATSRWSTRPSRSPRTAPNMAAVLRHRYLYVARGRAAAPSDRGVRRAHVAPTPSTSDAGALHRASGSGRLEQRLDLDNGRFAGQVHGARDPSWVMLKESYAPHWRATVDGKPVKTAMLAPSFVGVPVPRARTTWCSSTTRDVVVPRMLFAVGAAHAARVSRSDPRLWRRYRGAPVATPAEASKLR